MENLFIAIFLIVLWLIAASVGIARSPEALDRRARRRVERELRRKLDRDSYCVIYNVTLPAAAGSTTIDHVVVSRFGIFVIETRSFSGWAYGDSSQRTRGHLFRREETAFPDPLGRQLQAKKAITAFLQCDEPQVRAVLVFAGRGDFAAATRANVVYTDYLVPYIREHREPIISPGDVRRFADRLLDLEDTGEGTKPGGRAGAVDQP